MTTTAPTSSVASAGWYRDPLGIPQLRGWNGLTWTNHIQEPRPEFQTRSTDFSGSTDPTAA